MRQTKSLVSRVALIIAAFGILLSVMLSIGMHFTAQQIGHGLMDEALRAELEDSVAAHNKYKAFTPPNTVSIKGYIVAGEATGKFDPPIEIRKFIPGSYNVKISDKDYRVLVADRNGFRYFLLFNTDNQHETEKKGMYVLGIFNVVMTLASVGVGIWLSIHIISPVSKLASRVRNADPNDLDLPLEKLVRKDEIGDLARAFMEYLNRIKEYRQREQYFTADVSHELRTPIAIILGATEVLEKEETVPGKTLERVKRIKKAAQEMAELTSALLLLSREHRPIPGQMTKCNVGEVVKAVVEKHRYLITNRPIELQLDLSEEIVLNVEQTLLEIVLGNLLRNAFFNTLSGVVIIKFENGCVLIKDTGVGMSEDTLAHLFERYYKGEASKGAGVGMSIVKRICDRYGWKITIESEQRKGTNVGIQFLEKT
jgi:signal transduction histidine kinase